MTSKLLNLYEDNAHYIKAFQLFDSRADRLRSMEQFCESDFHNDIIPKLNVNLSKGEELRTLGIGSGSGKSAN